MIKISNTFETRAVMAFFSKKEKPEDKKEKVIRPIVVRTENVAKEMMNVAASNDVTTASLDFNILEIQTFTRMGSEGKDAEYEELASDEVVHLRGENMMLNPIFEIKQSYEVEVFSLSKPDPLSSLNLAVGANASLTKVFLTIKDGSTVTYFEGIETALVNMINKKKLRANMMVELFDEPMSEAVKELVTRIADNERLAFNKDEQLLIAQGIEPVATIDDALILHYEQRQELGEDDHGRVDYSKRGYLISAVVEEVLIEYIKPRIGNAGRNCRGEYLIPREPKVTHEPEFMITDKIEKIENDDKIEYRAKQSGYVTFEGNIYDINTEMDISEISFKATGSIESQLDADVSINVKETDIFKDAIGIGMEVEVKEINVDGNTGSNSKVHAAKVLIGGQTHQSSEIYADDISINIHKGTAVGKNVHITRLEHGVVEADEVTVSQAIGGTIRARIINVEILGSHVTMTAVERIEIGSLNGEENKFIIDPLVMMGSKETLSTNESEIKEAKRSITDGEKEIAKYKAMIEKNQSAFIELKKRLLHYKKNNVQMPTSFVKKYKQFGQLYAQVETLEKELVEKEEHLVQLVKDHKALQNDIFDARVVNNSRWQGHNEILFKLIEPETVVTLVPREDSNEHVFALYEDKENELFSVVAVSE